MGHHSVSKDLKKIISLINNIQFVEKVCITFSEGCRHKFAPGDVKIQQKTKTGFKMKGFTGKGVQYFYIYVKPTSKIDEVEEKIKRLVK